MESAIIDRWEANIAVLELNSGAMLKVSKSLLPALAREGDVIIYQEGKWLIDQAATLRRRQEIDRLRQEITAPTDNIKP